MKTRTLFKKIVSFVINFLTLLKAFVLTIEFYLLSLLKNNSKHKLIEREKEYGTNGDNLSIYHRVVEQDGGLGLKFPGFLIGIEKAYRKNKNIKFNQVETTLKNEFVSTKAFKEAKRILKDPKITFISHVVEYSLNNESVKEDIFYNAYKKSYNPETVKEGAYLGGLKALNELKERIDNKVGNKADYSHIILCSMGWNTDQQEALRNYNSLISLMMEKNKVEGSFKPLFIGISWPSDYKIKYFWYILFIFIPFILPVAFVLKYGISYTIKANDADEVGILWVNKILQDILVPVKLKENIPLILMGHSFGARIITRAAFSRGLIDLIQTLNINTDKKVSNDPTQKNHIDLIIGLQGAFSVNRFIPEVSWEGAPYKDFCEYAKKCIFTWSEHDNANPAAFWSEHIGGKCGYKRSIKYKNIFDHFKINVKENTKSYNVNFDSIKKEDEKQSNGWENSFKYSKKISIVDASDLIKNKPYGKGGNAHSDIYTPGIASFIWNCINNRKKNGENEVTL